ncbi:MAG: GNAT family N-acetyltransferase [Clostridiales bacterium]|nr:GNAT family N-acetyltransferase [Clostridiales bacterium]
MQMERIEIYNASLKDDVFTFTDECFRSVGKEFEPDGRHAFYNDIEKYFDRFWCLLSEGRVLGTVAVKRLDETTSELKALYLSPELRGKGYGYKLLDLAVLYAREKGYKRIVLDSMSHYTAALNLYEKYGFTCIKRYNDNQKADVFMEYIL